MPEDTFRLFPGDKQPSPGDAVIQFLIDEQKKGNKRAKAVGDFIGRQIEEVFPGFGVAAEGITAGAEGRRQQLNELFGLGLGEPDTSSVGEKALGFGVGSIKSVFGAPRLGIRLPRKPGEAIAFEKDFPVKVSEGSVMARSAQAARNAEIAARTRMNLGVEANINRLFTEFGQKQGPNIGGVRPPLAALESQAVKTQARKQIQTRVKETQKDLDALLIEEVNPLAPTNLVKELRAKGLKAQSGFNEGEGVYYVAFKSAKATTDELTEFGIVSTESGPVLSVNFNSPTIKPELQQVFKERFGNQFLDDYIEENAAARIAQRLKVGLSKDAPLPVNLSFYGVKDFDDGLQLINWMLDIVEEQNNPLPGPTSFLKPISLFPERDK